MTLSTSTKLGRYEIRSKIGAGGMGRMRKEPLKFSEALGIAVQIASALELRE